MRVAHVITGLGRGGAETALRRLVAARDRDRFEMAVFSISSDVPTAPLLVAEGATVEVIPLAGAGAPANLLRLTSRIRAFRPDVVQTWMYHADVAGGLIGKLALRRPVVWNVRAGDLLPSAWKRSTIATVKLAARLSHRVPTRIVCNSNAAAVFHRSLGYPEERMVVIPNGFDVAEVDEQARAAVRSELGVLESEVLVVRVGRFHPHKDHRTLARAIGRVARVAPEARFVLCGDGVSDDNAELRGWLDAEGATRTTRLLGPRDDVDRLHAAADIACSSSIGESMPNVVGEAMAAGVPVVVTDVGDSKLLVGDGGVVVPPDDPVALADAVVGLVQAGVDGRRAVGALGRRRIEDDFSMAATAERYQVLYEEMARRVRD